MKEKLNFKIFLNLVLFFILLFWFSTNIQAFWPRLIWSWWYNEMLFRVNGDADLSVMNSSGNITWYKTWFWFVEEIPWVNFLRVTPMPSNPIIYSSRINDDFKIIVNWNKTWKYDLFITWWNLFLNISNVKTKQWQIDEFVFRNGFLEENFDDKITWVYDLTLDNYWYTQARLYYPWVLATWAVQKISIDWSLVWKDKKSVKYEINWKTSNLKYWYIEQSENDFNYYIIVIIWFFIVILSCLIIRYFNKNIKRLNF